MKKKVFYLITGCFCVLSPALLSAQVLRSDLTLLKGAPDLDEEIAVDPYWDLSWHAKVAEYGDPDSQFLVAQIYEQGKLVPRNEKKAILYYKKAAEQGHLESCMRLGEIFADKNRKDYDAEQSLNWYLKAAKEGYAQAQLRLANIFEERADYVQASEWLTQAMRQMFPDEPDLTRVAPDLKRLAELKQKTEEK